MEVKTIKEGILIRARTSTRKHYGFVGAKKINEEFVLSLEQDWYERGESETL